MERRRKKRKEGRTRSMQLCRVTSGEMDDKDGEGIYMGGMYVEKKYPAKPIDLA